MEIMSPLGFKRLSVCLVDCLKTPGISGNADKISVESLKETEESKEEAGKPNIAPDIASAPEQREDEELETHEVEYGGKASL
ncbi:hypothetical protein CgunFtcFv8_006009 [Champsocephalus gunnari]|uniref:Uncharacterized protein n=1 Tax=Champsocephalus gunnari TaxID=52237 RepID=A0AAN8BWF0_CHAGU|nr:hypothetical protein CgunFtcFv8_006009 [Champsocephalus gunnari]